MSLVREVVERYDVDGVHFDYLRYPEHALRFSDSYTYKKYGTYRRKGNLFHPHESHTFNFLEDM